MPRLRAGTALVTEVRGGGFRRAPDSSWSREEVDSEDAYPSARYSGMRSIKGREYNVWKVSDQYFAQVAHENPLLELALVGALGLAAIGAGVYFAMKGSPAALSTADTAMLKSAIAHTPDAQKCSLSAVKATLAAGGVANYSDAQIQAAMTAAGCTSITA